MTRKGECFRGIVWTTIFDSHPAVYCFDPIAFRSVDPTPENRTQYRVAMGFVLTAILAVLAFMTRRKLPNRKMLVLTVVMLGVLLLPTVETIVGQALAAIIVLGSYVIAKNDWWRGIEPAE